MRVFLLFLLVFVCSEFSAQSVSGTISSIDGQSIPFASIYIKELTTGTTSNAEGIYSLRLDKGEYHIYFQALGFARKEIKIVVSNEDIEMDITLQEQDYRLKEVKVYSGKEDPAYAIMRKSISLAPYFQQQVKSYNADVYLKGGFDMDKIPLIMRKQLKEEGIEQGQNYVSESVNKIKFTLPNQYEHIQVSKRSSIPNDSEDQVMGFLNYSFYDVDNEDLISPLSRKSFSFYKFQYIGFFKQGDYYVNKIKVIPKRKNQKLFSGYIYIVDQLWNIHSVNLSNTQFFGTIKVKQVQEQVKERVWLPVSHLFDVDVKLMGFKLKANYSGSVDYHDIELNDALVIPESVLIAYGGMEEEKSDSIPQLSKNEKKIEALLQKDDLSNRDMLKLTRLVNKEKKEEKDESLEIEDWSSNYKVVKDTVKRDSIQWDVIRPIPLSDNEINSFNKSDSINMSLRSAEGDTTKAFNNHKNRSLFSKVISGYHSFSKDSALQISYPGLINLKAFDFNSVAGFSYMQTMEARWKLDTIHHLTVQPYLKYAFAQEQLTWKLENKYYFAPLQRGVLSLSAGQWFSDFNDESGTHPLLNAMSSLFFKENYLKLYQGNYIKGAIDIDIVNGLQFSSGLKHARYIELENSTDFALAYPSRSYEPNNEVSNVDSTYFNSRSSNSFSASLNYTPKNYYKIVHGRKVMQYSDFPTVSLSYRGAFDFGSSEMSNYNLMELRIRQELDWSFMYAFKYDLSIGKFFNVGEMHFSEFKHFNTSEIPISFKQWHNGFVLLNDYEYSSNDWFIQGHLNYKSPYLLLKNLPFLQDKLWNENLYLHFLTNEKILNYNELGYGISDILLVGSVGAFVSFENTSFKMWGVRVAITLW